MPSRPKKKVDTSGVQYFIAPDIKLPEETRGDWRHGTKAKGRHGDEAGEETAKRTFHDYFSSVKEYGKSSLSGQAAKKHKSDKLVALGVAPKKAQTMPFKMAIGINAGRAKRAARVREDAKQSGTVIAKSLESAGKKQKPVYRKTRNSGPDIDVKVRSGVLRVNKPSFKGRGRDKIGGGRRR